MAKTQQAFRLETHLRSLVTHYGNLPEQAAARILADPQGHVDALVEAGVLRLENHTTLYTVIQPKPAHQHEWRVAMDVDNVNAHVSTTVRLICHECHATHDVTNRLPIESPL